MTATLRFTEANLCLRSQSDQPSLDVDSCANSEGFALPHPSLRLLQPASSGRETHGWFYSLHHRFLGEPSPASLQQPVWCPGRSLSLVSKNTCMASSCEVLSCCGHCFVGEVGRGGSRGEEEAGHRWAGPLGRSSCPHVEAQWKDPGLSAWTLPPELPRVQPPALGGGSRGEMLGVPPSVSCRVGVIFLLPEVLRWGRGWFAALWAS